MGEQADLSLSCAALDSECKDRCLADTVVGSGDLHEGIIVDYYRQLGDAVKNNLFTTSGDCVRVRTVRVLTETCVLRWLERCMRHLQCSAAKCQLLFPIRAFPRVEDYSVQSHARPLHRNRLRPLVLIDSGTD